MSYYSEREESCNLPSVCDCSACRWWGENGWDLSRTPDWQQPTNSEED